ncbi:YjbH domain-containing protein [Seleniivibrio woodruffii]|uniref:YjbH domain-containing protein n=1 Tax=Seleniivibrio woodruffii TaxID=1078050 RepID=UPI0026F2501C|nr:YjbH domain-containing protein [Seleniivibrio woodruffii]
MKKVLFCLLLICSLSAAFAESPEGYFSSSSENGLTGIFETPTARIMDENTFRVFFNQSKPYRNYGVGVSLYDRLELSGRFTEILGADMSETDEDYWGNYGDFKDKFVAAKLRIRKESKYLPEISVGLNDPHGTKHFSAQYLVMSKQVYPFDFSFGVGLGRFGDKPFSEYSKKDMLVNFVNLKEYYNNGNPFFSINFRPSDKYAIVYEYSPVDYEKQKNDPALQYGLVHSDSKHSIGIRYHVADNLYLTASYQRGNQIGFGVTTPFRIGNPLIPIFNAKPYYGADVKESGDDYVKIRAALNGSGLDHYNIYIENDTAYIDFQNSRYFFEYDALKAFVDSLYAVKPNVKNYVVTVSSNGVQIYNFRTDSELIALYGENKITFDEMYSYMYVRTDYRDMPMLKGLPKYEASRGTYGILPNLNFYINDPSGFFKGAMGVRGWVGYDIADNLTAVGGLAYYPVNNISTINENMQDAVRSDVADYTDNAMILDMALFDYKDRIRNTDIFANIEAGILEMQYSGVNAEAAVPFFNNRFLLGVSGSYVKKRDSEDMVGLADRGAYHTAFVKTRVHFDRIKTYVDVDAGRFLAGDVGAKVKITKKINDVEISAWVTKTDTSGFDSKYNRGYTDKGIMFTIPLRLFSGKDSRTVYSQKFVPWTRDVGAQVSEFTPLFDYVDRNYKK